MIDIFKVKNLTCFVLLFLCEMLFVLRIDLSAEVSDTTKLKKNSNAGYKNFLHYYL